MTVTLTIDAVALAAALRVLSWLFAVLAVALYVAAARYVWRMADAPHFEGRVPLWARVLVSAFWPIGSIAGILLGWWQDRRARKAAP